MVRFISGAQYRGDVAVQGMFSEIVSELHDKNSRGCAYSAQDVDDVSRSILERMADIGAYANTNTPVVKIANALGFSVRTEEMWALQSGKIQVNCKAEGDEGRSGSKAILLNKEDNLFHQRFVIAHELAHYLFDCVGKVEQGEPYEDTYLKDHHGSESERRANRFAAELLMPQKLFVEMYGRACRRHANYISRLMYLSKYFEVPIASIERRIKEVLG